jgi:DtxR family Mn-dependent transcriptional regulator
VQTLGYSWDEVHNEAEKLEHVISEEFEARIAAAMGNPMRDPHGDPIPSANLVMPKDESTLLSNLQIKQAAIICKVQSHDINLLKHLESLGLVIGAGVKILEISLYGHIMKLQVRGRKEAVVLGPVITNRVFVEFN